MARDLRVLVFREGDVFVAQCLEYDICTFAADLGLLRQRIDGQIESERQLSSEMHGRDFAGIQPAPEIFLKMWDDAPRLSKVVARLVV